MAEKLTLPAPYQGGTEFTLVRMVKDRENEYLEVVIRDQYGRRYTIYRLGSVALALMSALNTNNNATKSEDRRVIEWAQNQPDGIPAGGTFSGTPA